MLEFDFFSAWILFIDLYSLFIFPVICTSLSPFLNKPMYGGFYVAHPIWGNGLVREVQLLLEKPLFKSFCRGKATS